MSITELRRRLGNAIDATGETDNVHGTSRVVDAVMEVLTTRSIMEILSGLSEEVILRRGGVDHRS